MTTCPTPPDAATTLADLPAGKKLLLLAGNSLGLLHLLAVGVAIGLTWQRPWLCTTAALAVLYLAPPLVCRLVLALRPVRRSIIPLGTGDFFTWWFCLNLQMVFCRLPFLEELLRFVPGGYSLWLRLWGARIGKLTYWTAGLRILDRQLLQVGDHVTFGAGVRLNPHVIMPDQQGRLVLMLAPVVIGDRANVGGYALLVAGATVAPGETTRAYLILPPFHRLENGQRHKPTDPALRSPDADPDQKNSPADPP